MSESKLLTKEELKQLIKDTVTEVLKGKEEPKTTPEDWLKHAENCPQCQALLKKFGWVKHEEKKSWF